jgi:hypothetical protein
VSRLATVLPLILRLAVPIIARCLRPSPLKRSRKQERLAAVHEFVVGKKRKCRNARVFPELEETGCAIRLPATAALDPTQTLAAVVADRNIASRSGQRIADRRPVPAVQSADHRGARLLVCLRKRCISCGDWVIKIVTNSKSWKNDREEVDECV